MLGKSSVYRYLIVPIIFVVSLFVLLFPISLASSFASSSSHGSSRIGPKKYYLALGDSLAFGYQPDFDFFQGYVDDFFTNLKKHGVKHLVNLGCFAETSSTFINGKCPVWYLRKQLYPGSQLEAALNFLHSHSGQVSPVTLDIGANDLQRDIKTSNCTISSNFDTDLTRLDKDLTGIILPQLKKAMTVNGKLTGDIVLMNYYDPYQSICPKQVSYIRKFNEHLAEDVRGFGVISDVFSAFGGSKTPNPNICSYTWMCSIFHDIHATNKGYSVMASAFEKSTGY
ncbi:MAG: SGNH/GDSL hydrolase family protein [Ktedonobacteraceae bacterium]